MLATIVVMVMTPPRTRRELAVAIIATVVASLCGGAAVIQHFGLHGWTGNLHGAMALGGVYFSCGLPGWAVVLWLFNFIKKRSGKDLAEVAEDVRDAVAGGKHG